MGVWQVRPAVRVGGAPEKDATVICLGRAVFPRSQGELGMWAKTVEPFERQVAIEVVATIGDCAMVSAGSSGIQAKGLTLDTRSWRDL